MGLLNDFLNLEVTFSNILAASLITVLTGIVSRIFYMQFLHPLSKYPGPWYATSFSLFGAMLSVLGKEHEFLLYLSKKYKGKYQNSTCYSRTPSFVPLRHLHTSFCSCIRTACRVTASATLKPKTQPLTSKKQTDSNPIRMSPTTLLFPHASALKDIYWDPRCNTKSGIYGTGALGTPQNLFDIIDGEQHKALRKALSNAPWTIGQLKKHWEPRFDDQVHLFIAKMREHAAARRVICLSDKVAEFAADIMSMISFGEAFGCVKNQRDEKRILENWRKGLVLFGLLTRFRFLRDVLIPKTFIGKLILPKAAEEEGMGWLMAEADRQVTERERAMTEDGLEGKKDFMQQ
jgi:hypothetical protein